MKENTDSKINIKLQKLPFERIEEANSEVKRWDLLWELEKWAKLTKQWHDHVRLLNILVQLHPQRPSNTLTGSPQYVEQNSLAASTK